MSVIPKEKADFNNQSRQLEVLKFNNDEKSLKDRFETLKKQHEAALEAKEQAVNMNYFLENQLNNANREIELLNEEINKLVKEKKELEEMKEVLFRLVYYFAKRELGM